jgi:hypothetical protein
MASPPALTAIVGTIRVGGSAFALILQRRPAMTKKAPLNER